MYDPVLIICRLNPGFEIFSCDLSFDCSTLTETLAKRLNKGVDIMHYHQVTNYFSHPNCT